MVVGYIRVSLGKQDTEYQQKTIETYCKNNKIILDKLYATKISSNRDMISRKVINIIDELQTGDTLILTELSRIGRSIKDIIYVVNELEQKDIRLISIAESIDTSKKNEMMTNVLISVFALIADVERKLISQRTK